jgi:hypothetical protein
MKIVRLIFENHVYDCSFPVEPITDEEIKEKYIGNLIDVCNPFNGSLQKCIDCIILNESQKKVETYVKHFVEMRNEMDFNKKIFLNHIVKNYCDKENIMVLPIQLSNNFLIYVKNIPIAEYVSEKLPNGDLKFYSYVKYL